MIFFQEKCTLRSTRGTGCWTSRARGAGTTVAASCRPMAWIVPTGEFCVQHNKRDGMVDVKKKRRCAHEGCGKQSPYGIDGTKLAEFCSEHKAGGMVDLISKRCGHHASNGCLIIIMASMAATTTTQQQDGVLLRTQEGRDGERCCQEVRPPRVLNDSIVRRGWQQKEGVLLAPLRSSAGVSAKARRVRLSAPLLPAWEKKSVLSPSYRNQNGARLLHRSLLLHRRLVVLVRCLMFHSIVQIRRLPIPPCWPPCPYQPRLLAHNNIVPAYASTWHFLTINIVMPG